MSTDTPPPGSREAVKAGCTCPIVDNHFGRGAYPTKSGPVIYIYNATCPVHNPADDRP